MVRAFITADGRRDFVTMIIALVLAVGLVTPISVLGEENHLTITRAEWHSNDLKLFVEGAGPAGREVVVSSAASGEVLATTKVEDNGTWKLTVEKPSPVPCRVRATSNGETAESSVANAPLECDQGGGGVPPVAGGFRVLAANDLGMHCADQDYQVMSILPPFNVVHAQVLQQGTSTSLPRIVDDTEVAVFYSAATNPNDPVGGLSINTTSQNYDTQGGLRAFKTNFWDTNPASGLPIGFDAYAPLYFGLLPPAAIRPDVGLPVPDSVLLPIFECLNDPRCLAQQEMPGIAAPYTDNVPKAFARFDRDFNFFSQFPFGAYVTGVNWFAADGIPVMPIDDAGRVNAYPLMKVEARGKAGGEALAAVDVVLPVASEADCQSCHANQDVCNFEPALGLTCNGIAADLASVDFEVITDASNAPGINAEQQVANAAKINILRLHDAKHGTTLDASRPVVCQTCHYSPALDLAQLGPTDDPSLGVEQTRHHSMSYAMHFHHGNLTFMGEPVFPQMPPPIDEQGDLRDPLLTQQVLEENCYECHPGKRTQCLRGAMFSGGMVCQDCHGELQQVGNDFSKNFPTTPGVITAGLRVPWADEPGCQSCHTGDAVNNLTGDPDVLVAKDGIRLLQAFRSNDPAATPIEAATSAFAEDESLFRLSKGHGGVMCEACHGSTHAIWPVKNPLSNDSVTAEQLQGHTGTIIECTSCHAAGSFTIDDFRRNLDADGRMKGPHGMHPVANPTWTHKHEYVYKEHLQTCRSCHGGNLDGTVLARMAIDRTLECDDTSRPGCERTSEGKRITLTKGTEVSCDLCHSKP